MTIQSQPPVQPESLNPESQDDISVWKQFNSFWTPYRLSATIFFTLFLGADVSLFLFGKSATGNVFIALVLTLLSGVGVLRWKRQRDHKDSNEKQRSIALSMIIIHAVAAVIFLGGNFAKGGWDALSSSIKIDGQLASQLLDYHIVLEKIFLWTIVIMLSANLIALFWFMEVDTEKSHARAISKMLRANQAAKLKAQEKEIASANSAYEQYSGMLAEIRGLQYTRDRLLAENSKTMAPAMLELSLAEIDRKILELSGAIPAPSGLLPTVPHPSDSPANSVSSEETPFTTPTPRSVK